MIKSMNPTAHTLTNGIAGMCASALAVLTTFQEQLEWWIRISGGVLGLMIACITLCKLLHQKKP